MGFKGLSTEGVNKESADDFDGALDDLTINRIDSDDDISSNSNSLVSMDLSEELEGGDASSVAVNGAENNSWLTSWLLNGAEEDDVDGPNGNIQLVIQDEEGE